MARTKEAIDLTLTTKDIENLQKGELIAIRNIQGKGYGVFISVLKEEDIKIGWIQVECTTYVNESKEKPAGKKKRKGKK